MAACLGTGRAVQLPAAESTSVPAELSAPLWLLARPRAVLQSGKLTSEKHWIDQHTAMGKKGGRARRFPAALLHLFSRCLQEAPA